MDVDLFIQEGVADEYQLYREAGYPLSTDDLLRLRQRGVKQLFIRAGDREHYQQYLRDLAETALGDSGPDIQARMTAVNAVVQDVLKTDLATRDAARVVKSADYLGRMTADLILHDDFASSDMLQVLHHDYTTFTHSTNVSFYAAMLAAELGFSAEDVRQIAAGGLLHDFGKLEIDDRILRKLGRLNGDEISSIQRHPTIGFRRLADRQDLTYGQLMMVYQHHEQMDGAGYPVGCEGDEIHPWARICAIVDVFEALTSHRPYREAMAIPQAFRILHRGSGSAFDSEILACWTSIIQTA
jgi:HD-GYP domain-containing protein (c-di-GMP phosphodiesterase class II)